jgi:queuine tRNA-ribosyltransferase
MATHDPAADIIPPRQTLFPIIQGGVHPALRVASARGILDRGPWDGIAIGGLSVGESKPDMYATLEVVDPVIPRTVPRYMMGVGFPDDLVEAVRRGVDLFDCVAPTRMGRNGTAFTSDGPLDDDCPCPCCTQYDRAYLRHLFVSEEMLGLRLLSLHNVAFLITLMARAREALRQGTFDHWSSEWLTRYRATAGATAA